VSPSGSTCLVLFAYAFSSDEIEHKRYRATAKRGSIYKQMRAVE